jgi:Domain of unknown function (DUF5134)
MPPAWLFDAFAALMLAVSAVSVMRLARTGASSLRRPATEPTRLRAALTGPARVDGVDNEVAFGLTGVAMAGMLVSSLTTLQPAAWEAIFGALTAWFLWRFTRESPKNASLAGSHSMMHVIHSGAMVYLFAAATMSGMLEYPALALAFASVFICYAVWDLVRSAGPRETRGSASSADAAPARSILSSAATAAGCRIAVSVTMAFMMFVMT